MIIKWDEVDIKRNDGEIVKGKAPVIISASRSTDIPAFFTKWLIQSLKKGYVVWYNPFNRKKPYYVSFKKAKVFVFWSKNPKPLIPYLEEFDKRKIHYYFQFTLNDYEKERFEPNLPPLKERIEIFKKLSEKIGKERVIWRFDPLIVTPELSPRELLKKIWNIGNQLKHYTDKLVFSFVDVNVYKKVQNNLIKETNLFSRESVKDAELNQYQIKEVVEGLYKIKKAWSNVGWNIEFATCGEEMNYDRYGIVHNKCIDDELLKREFNDDKELMHFLDYGKLPEPNLDLFGNFAEKRKRTKKMKDAGQRKACGCIYSKDIGMYNTCSHFCVYCYANTSKTIVEKNVKLFSNESESIINL